ncbi:MAG TPA: hypothetical protein VLF18_02235 [Tahibacter sp.]|uniref:hypothetical protein n=1 Tax=Tahibacter sp. TaxID=2056211 RepID=UPI002CDF41DB|nr:hypothetical protein [Tahibacter sp.]HSX58995.1 hypothetical protein [Tahibacter sp.]
MRHLISCIAGLLLGAGTAMAHEGPLDPTFGDSGMRNYGFQAVNGALIDRAYVGCPGPDGTFTIVGAASGWQRVVTVRLRDNGDYETSFSDDGKQSFDLPATPAEFSPGACQADGHVVVARAITAPDGEQNLQIFRVLKSTGLPDGSFGTGGVIGIDLDQWIPNLAKEELPLGVNQLANGDIAVSGRVVLAVGGERGFVVLLAANGSLRRAAILDNLRSRTATTVVDAPDGRLWAFGQNGRVNGAYRAVLNRDSLIWEGVLEQQAPPGYTTWVGNGRAVDGQTIVLASSSGPTPAYSAPPQLIVFRGDSVSAFTLPIAPVGGQGIGVVARFGLQGVTVLPRRRVLFGALAMYAANNTDVGIHFAMGEIGTTSADDRVDTMFGDNGAQTAIFRPTANACNIPSRTHRYGRLTLWRNRPVFVGGVDASCLGTGAGEDYLVARLQTDDIFAGAFD